MKTHLITISLFLLLVSGCHDSAERDLRINTQEQEFLARAGEIVVDANRDNLDFPFVFRVSKIQESRCPSEIQCIRLGEVLVFTELRFLEQDQFTSIEFCLGDCAQQRDGFTVADTLEVDFQDNAYRFVLKAVSPYPLTLGTNLDQAAIFEITVL